MRHVGAILFLVVGGVVSACGAKEPPRAETPPTPATSTPPANDAARPLDRGECEALAKVLLDACENRGNTHSSQIDRWCSGLVHRLSAEGEWIEKECMAHIRHIDATCFHNTTGVRDLMDCESMITHAQ